MAFDVAVSVRAKFTAQPFYTDMELEELEELDPNFVRPTPPQVTSGETFLHLQYVPYNKSLVIYLRDSRRMNDEWSRETNHIKFTAADSLEFAQDLKAMVSCFDATIASGLDSDENGVGFSSVIEGDYKDCQFLDFSNYTEAGKLDFWIYRLSFVPVSDQVSRITASVQSADFIAAVRAFLKSIEGLPLSDRVRTSDECVRATSAI